MKPKQKNEYKKQIYHLFIFIYRSNEPKMNEKHKNTKTNYENICKLRAREKERNDKIQSTNEMLQMNVCERKRD